MEGPEIEADRTTTPVRYLFRVTHAGTVIFQREFPVERGRSFRRDLTDAYAAFRKECPDVNLYDEGVAVDLNPKN